MLKKALLFEGEIVHTIERNGKEDHLTPGRWERPIMSASRKVEHILDQPPPSLSAGAPADLPRTLSPYTQAMAQCLAGLQAGRPQPLDPAVAQRLTNLIQGRMLEFLADQICANHKVTSPRLREGIIRALLAIFSEEFFALFRSKIRARPDLLVIISRRILRVEGPQLRNPHPRYASRLFPAVFRKYFEYTNLNLLLQMVESDAYVQRMLLESSLEGLPGANPAATQALLNILDNDAEGLCTGLFYDQVRKGNLAVLLEKIADGRWRDEVETLRLQLSRLRGG